MFDAAHPGGAALDSHSIAGVRDAAEAAEVEIPFEGFARKIVCFQLFFKVFKRGRAFAAADDLAVAFGSEEVDPKGGLRTVLIHFEIETLDGRREVMNKNWLAELTRQIRLIGRTEIAAPFEIVFK